MGNITVVGSINVDLVTVSEKRPKVGETVIGKDLLTIPGGKGGNQAVAAARLGGKVQMIGKVGKDDYGNFSIQNLNTNGVDTTLIDAVEDCTTGVAVITVAEGDNSIIVIPGANAQCTPALGENEQKAILNSDLVVLQLEIPLETVKHIVNICHENGVKVLLNPAPACALPEEVIDQVTYLTPNEHEFGIIFGAEANQEATLRRYPNKLIVTEGEKGSVFFDGEKIHRVPAQKVQVRDTTGAGDTFNGAFAVAILEGKSMGEAIDFANKAAGISVTKMGAQGGMPTRTEFDEKEGQ